ncbi:unnamed protein product [Oppiella nova]|uniref:Uncharacterized protein n=1 Tax=Oppiella nova TaxID=334625 RepID=A0A7R9M0Y4_9ACAR|nr:unnamed protein product [Oppiella nova]CAG2168766.1 unnamed protein product [Oppiella nova]
MDFWHTFIPTGNGWYTMLHHDNTTHQVKISKSPDQGYYYIYNTGCRDGNYPNAENPDDRKIYCDEPGNNTQERVKYNWEFTNILTEVGKYYNINSTMTNFKYEKPSKEQLDKHLKLNMVGNLTFPNCSPDNLTREATLEKTLTQTYSISMKEAYMWATEVSWEVDKKVRETQLSTTKEYKITKEIVSVPPDMCIKALSYVKWIDNLELPYQAVIQISIPWMVANTLFQKILTLDLSSAMSLTLTQSYSITMEESHTFVNRFCGRFSVTAGVSGDLMGIVEVSVSTTAELEWELGQESSETRGTQLSATKEYKISDRDCEYTAGHLH